MRRLLLVLAMIALHARTCAAASRQLNFVEFAQARCVFASSVDHHRLSAHARPLPLAAPQQETAVGLIMGLGTTAAVGMATANPGEALVAGAAVGTAASLTTGATLQAFKVACQRNPNCTMPRALQGQRDAPRRDPTPQ